MLLLTIPHEIYFDPKYTGLNKIKRNKGSNHWLVAGFISILLLSSFAVWNPLQATSTAVATSGSGLVAEWKFEGNTFDTSGTGNNGDGTTYVPGKIGQAISFNGINNVVVVPNSPTLNFGSTGSFTISTWMKSTQSGFGVIVDDRRNNDGVYAGYSIEDSSGTLIARIRDNSGHDVPVVATSNVNNGVFHHIVFTVDRSTQTEKLYLDNTLQATASISNVGDTNSPYFLTFGGDTPPNTLVNFYSGIIDQVRIYGRSLSTSEIQNLFTETRSSSVPMSGLVGQWKFEGNTFDTSGTGNNGDGTTYVPGKIGQAISFDGTDDVVRVTNNPTLNFGSTGSFTILGWLKTTTQASALLLDHRPNNDGIYQGWSIELNNGKIIGEIRDGAANDVPVFSSPINDNQFHRFIFVVDRSTQTEKLYLEDILQDSKSIASVGNIDSVTDVLLGGQAPPNTPVDFYNGLMDQVRIYNKALSDSDIQSIR